MHRRAMLGSLVAAASALLAGCGGSGDRSTPRGTLIGGTTADGGGGGDGGGSDGGDGGGGGDPGTTTEPPTTGARDVFTGVDYGVEAAEGGTLTAWTVENTSDLTWSVTVVSTLTVGTEGTDATPETSEASERITVASGEQTTVELVHDVAFDAWEDFSFDFRDLERA